MSVDSYKCRSTVMSGDRQLSPSTVVSVDGQLITVAVKKEVLLMALTSHRMYSVSSKCSSRSADNNGLVSGGCVRRLETSDTLDSKALPSVIGKTLQSKG